MKTQLKTQKSNISETINLGIKQSFPPIAVLKNNKNQHILSSFVMRLCETWFKDCNKLLFPCFSQPWIHTMLCFSYCHCQPQCTFAGVKQRSGDKSPDLSTTLHYDWVLLSGAGGLLLRVYTLWENPYNTDMPDACNLLQSTCMCPLQPVRAATGHKAHKSDLNVWR